MEKKEMTKLQIYAVKAASDKLTAVRQEFQEVVDLIAKEMNLDAVNEKWALSADMKSLEKRELPIVKEPGGKGKDTTADEK